MTDEVYKPIEGAPNYMVSNKGNVKNIKRGRVLAQVGDGNGYIRPYLNIKGKGRYVRVHRLVAMAFIPNPEKLPMVNHIDENRSNNIVSNLEWCDAQHNIAHSRAGQFTVTDPSGEVITFINLSQYCRDNDLNIGSMSRVCSGKLHIHKGYKPYNWSETNV